MHPRSGKTSGHIQIGDRILWSGWIFGLPQIHHMVVTAYNKPVFFQDTMERGRFKRFQQDHHLAEVDGHTLLHDKVKFSLPLGWPGKVIARRFLVPFFARRLRARFELIKLLAESDQWHYYVPEGTP